MIVGHRCCTKNPSGGVCQRPCFCCTTLKTTGGILPSLYVFCVWNGLKNDEVTNHVIKDSDDSSDDTMDNNPIGITEKEVEDKGYKPDDAFDLISACVGKSH